MKPTLFLLYTAEQKQFAELHCSSTLIIFGSRAQFKGFFLVSNPASLIDLAAVSPHPQPYQCNGEESTLENGGKIIKLPLLLRQPLSKSSLTGPGYWILIFQAAEHIQAIYYSSCHLYHSKSQIHTFILPHTGTCINLHLPLTFRLIKPKRLKTF